MSPSSGRRIGLLGGTFDPPHLGHLVGAEVARVALDLGEVQFVVAGAPWMKERCSPAEDRVRMVELATADNLSFRVNRREVDRGGPTYTAETLEELKSDDRHADLYFLLGADAAAKFPRWQDAEKNLELATFVVLTRPGYPVVLDGPLLSRFRRLDIPAVGVSSTDLRRRFQEGEAVRYQLPDPVADYVRARSLYGAEVRPW